DGEQRPVADFPVSEVIRPHADQVASRQETRFGTQVGHRAVTRADLLRRIRACPVIAAVITGEIEEWLATVPPDLEPHPCCCIDADHTKPGICVEPGLSKRKALDALAMSLRDREHVTEELFGPLRAVRPASFAEPIEANEFRKGVD